MKNNFELQTTARPATMMIGKTLFSSNQLAKKDDRYTGNFLPSTVSIPVVPVIKIFGNEGVLKPFFNRPFKQVAARLSEIELALDCYDSSGLQFAIHDLKNLFLDMSIPAVCRIAGQMEELAKENQFEDMKDLLREIKKIIGRIVKHRMQTVD